MAAERGRVSRLRLSIFAAAAVVLMGALWGGSAELGILPSPGSTVSKTELRIPDLRGFSYEVIDTRVDTLAKWEYISVYVSTAGKAHGWPLSLLLSPNRSLLFRYDPGLSTNLPSITAPNPNDVFIAVPRVSSVIYQIKRWDGLAIHYQIGHNDNPSAGVNP